MIVLVTGGRFWKRRDETFQYLSLLHKQYCITLIVHGDAEGADSLANEWAITNDVPIASYSVTQEEWETLGRSAGCIRNQFMLDQHEIDLVVAFPGERGTADMIARAEKTDIDVVRWVDTLNDNNNIGEEIDFYE